MSEERLNTELAAIEAALCSLTPAATGIERDRLMFLAGKAAATRAAAREFPPPRNAAPLQWGSFGMGQRLLGDSTRALSLRRRFAAMFWPIATAASLLAAVSFGVLWAASDGSRTSRQPATLFAAMPPAFDACAEESPPSPWANRRLCRLVLEKGIDAMPESTGHGGSGARLLPREETYRDLLNQFLDNPTG